MIPRLRRNIPDAHQVLWARSSLGCRRRRPRGFNRRWGCLLFDDWLGLNTSVGLPALVALIIALCHKLLSLLAQAATMAVHQQEALRLVDRMPLGADVRAAGNTHLAGWLHQVRHLLLDCPVDLDWRRCGGNRGGRSPAIDWRRGRSGDRLCSGRDEVGLARTACQRQISLFEVAHIELQRIQAGLVDHVFDVMNDTLWHVVFTPDGCCHCPTFATDADNIVLVPT